MTAEIDEGTPVIEILHQAHRAADWDLVESVYRQCIRIASEPDSGYLPDVLPSYLAELLGRVASNYIGNEERLAWHAMAVFANADTEPHESLGAKEFQLLYSDGRFHRFAVYSADLAERFHKRRRPTPFETIVESCRRLRDLNGIEVVFRDPGVRTAGILGGSLSYGRFYNVCGSGTGKSSDVDLVVLIERPEQLLSFSAKLSEVAGMSQADVTSFHQRANHFLNAGLHDGRTVFSHKFRMWADGGDPLLPWVPISTGYLASLHFFTPATLDYLLVADSTKLKRDMAGIKRSLRDYREKSAIRVDHQRSFGGRDNRLALSVEKTPYGYLRRSRVYVIDGDDQYYPGMFQNLIAPRFDIRWESLNVKAKLDSFRWKLVERLQHERRIRPHEFLRLSLSHTRSEVFAPHIARDIDRGAYTA